MSSPTLSPIPPPPGFSLGGYVTPDGTPEGIGFWPRALARIIDMAVHFLVSLVAGVFLGIVVAIVLAASGGDTQATFAKFGKTTAGAYIFAAIGYLLYHTICEGLHGSTLGKLIMGQVVLTPQRRPCGLKAALVRSLGYYVDGLFFGAVGYFHMQKTNMHQRYGDDWADTVVCKRSLAPPEALRGGGRFMLAFGLGVVADGVCLVLGTMTNLF